MQFGEKPHTLLLTRSLIPCLHTHQHTRPHTSTNTPLCKTHIHTQSHCLTHTSWLFLPPSWAPCHTPAPPGGLKVQTAPGFRRSHSWLRPARQATKGAAGGAHGFTGSWDLSSGSPPGRWRGHSQGAGCLAGLLAASRPLNDSCHRELDSCVTSPEGRAAPSRGKREALRCAVHSPGPAERSDGVLLLPRLAEAPALPLGEWRQAAASLLLLPLLRLTPSLSLGSACQHRLCFLEQMVVVSRSRGVGEGNGLVEEQGILTLLGSVVHGWSQVA